MKKKMVVFYSLMFLPLVVVLIALQFLPEQIPAHYDMNNQVTRWGSKYETLIFPVITVLFGYFMLAMAKLSSKQEENGSNNKNVCIVTGIVSLALFNAMTVYFLYADFNSIENLSSIALDLNQLVFGLLGVAMIILGNIMPKLRMNSVVGLRSVWSMKNETTWKKGQRFGTGRLRMYRACSSGLPAAKPPKSPAKCLKPKAAKSLSPMAGAAPSPPTKARNGNPKS